MEQNYKKCHTVGRLSLRASNMIFKSKIDVWVLVLTFGVAAMALLPLVLISFSWWDLVLPTLVLLFLIDMFSNTKYIIKDEKLIVECGHFMKAKYSILEIENLSASHSWDSAPALSIDRIRITIVGGNSILVSPKNKNGFINAITSINENVKLVRL